MRMLSTYMENSMKTEDHIPFDLSKELFALNALTSSRTLYVSADWLYAQSQSLFRWVEGKPWYFEWEIVTATLAHCGLDGVAIPYGDEGYEELPFEYLVAGAIPIKSRRYDHSYAYELDLSPRWKRQYEE